MTHPRSTPMGRAMHGRGLIEIVQAVRATVDGAGNEYLDCMNFDTGTPYPRCPYVGYDRLPLRVPREAFNEHTKTNPSQYPLVIIAHRGNNMSPVVLGPARNPGVARTSSEYEPPDAGDDDTAQPTLDDHVVENGGTRVTVRSNGAVTIAANADVSIILNGNALKVSDAGDAEGRIALVAPTVSKLNEIIATQTALKKVVSLLAEAAAAAADPITGAATIAAIETALAEVSDVLPATEETMRTDSVHVPGAVG